LAAKKKECDELSGFLESTNSEAETTSNRLTSIQVELGQAKQEAERYEDLYNQTMTELEAAHKDAQDYYEELNTVKA
jgi:prefoldin subunit 5